MGPRGDVCAAVTRVCQVIIPAPPWLVRGRGNSSFGIDARVIYDRPTEERGTRRALRAGIRDSIPSASAACHSWPCALLPQPLRQFLMLLSCVFWHFRLEEDENYT